MTPSVWRSPWRWYGFALIPIGIGGFMYALEADGVESSRLRDPVPVRGEFVTAECVTTKGRNHAYYLRTTYAFIPTGFVPYQQEPAAPKLPATFTTLGDVEFPSPEACEAALPAALAARAPHALWFEKDQPYTARTTLEEPDSARFLWVCLGAVPLLFIGWLLGKRQRRLARQGSQP